MTKSELAVAQLVADGLTNREIADRLFVSPHTVNTHLRRVFAKLQVNSRVETAECSSWLGRCEPGTRKSYLQDRF
jgi:DNA-binding CsgD family transcriptional regulator